MIRRNFHLTLLALLTLMALISAAGAQTPVAGDGRDADRAAIRAHIDSIFQGFITKDAARLRATHAEDWRGFLTGSRSVMRGIEEYMRGNEGSIKNPNSGMTGYRITEFDVTFQGDLALVFFVAEIDARYGDSKVSDKLRLLDIYGKRNGHWIQVATHTARHPEAIAQQNSTPAQINQQTKKAILDAREAVWRAWFGNDRPALEKMIPAEAIAINEGDEAWADRAAILAGAERFASTGARLVRLEFPRTEMQVYGSTIILYTTYLYEIENGGKRETRAGRGTEVFVSRNGTFVNTGWHLDANK